MRRIANFKETSKKVELTMEGWDGTGYNGEGKKMNVWENDAFPNDIFVCKWMPCFRRYCVLKVNTSRKHSVSGLPTAYVVDDFSSDELVK